MPKEKVHLSWFTWKSRHTIHFEQIIGLDWRCSGSGSSQKFDLQNEMRPTMTWGTVLYKGQMAMSEKDWWKEIFNLIDTISKKYLFYAMKKGIQCTKPIACIPRLDAPHICHKLLYIVVKKMCRGLPTPLTEQLAFFAEGWLYVHCNQNIPMGPSSVPNHGAMSVARNSFYCMEGSFMEFNVLIINMHNSWDVIKMWSEDSKFSIGLNKAKWSEQIIGVTCSSASNLWHHPLAEPDNELSGIFVNFSQIRCCGYCLGSWTMQCK